jgi:hypothetical protein
LIQLNSLNNAINKFNFTKQYNIQLKVYMNIYSYINW